jgi:hypothetical protein
MAGEKNLLLRLPCLNVEDLEAIAGAAGVGPSGLITWHSYYRDAARDPRLGLLDREVVIEKLHDLPFWPQAREALRKLETPLEELKRACGASANSPQKS